MMASSNGNISALLALCVGNSPVTSEFRAQRPVVQSFDIFFDLRLNKQLSKQSWGWWFAMPSHSLWHQCNVTCKISAILFRSQCAKSAPILPNDIQPISLQHLCNKNKKVIIVYPQIKAVFEALTMAPPSVDLGIIFSAWFKWCGPTHFALNYRLLWQMILNEHIFLFLNHSGVEIIKKIKLETLCL